jgi:heptosyltransferase II
MGDAVISLGTLEYLRTLLPDTVIAYAVPEWVLPLFQNVGTPADKIIGFQLKTMRDWWKTWQQVRLVKPDMVFELSQQGRTSAFFKLYALISGAKYVFHNHHTKKGPVLDQGQQKPILQRDLDGAWSFFSEFSQDKKVPHFLDFPPKMEIVSNVKHKRIVLGIVATRQTKMYPLEMYAQAVEILSSRWPGYSFEAPISGSVSDQRIGSEMNKICPLVKCVTLPLSQIPQYLKESAVYVGNDTGLKHVSVAVGLSTVTLFGPEPPLEWHPYATQEHPFLYIDKTPCRYETGHFCPLSTCTSMVCLKKISPQEVAETVSSLLNRGPIG